MTEITAELVRDLFHYDADTGMLIWRKHRYKRLIGTVAGSDNGKGYIKIKVRGKMCLAHRLVWLHVYGLWPRDTIDHINHNRSDNRVENLRDIAFTENVLHRRRSTNSVSGVTWCKTANRWKVMATIKGRRNFIGRFDNFDDAVAARIAVA